MVVSSWLVGLGSFWGFGGVGLVCACGLGGIGTALLNVAGVDGGWRCWRWRFVFSWEGHAASLWGLAGPEVRCVLIVVWRKGAGSLVVVGGFERGAYRGWVCGGRTM